MRDRNRGRIGNRPGQTPRLAFPNNGLPCQSGRSSCWTLPATNPRNTWLDGISEQQTDQRTWWPRVPRTQLPLCRYLGGKGASVRNWGVNTTDMPHGGTDLILSRKSYPQSREGSEQKMSGRWYWCRSRTPEGRCPDLHIVNTRAPRQHPWTSPRTDQQAEIGRFDRVCIMCV